VRQNDRWVGAIDIAYVQWRKMGDGTAAMADETLRISLTDQERAQAAEHGLIISRELSLDETRGELKVVVRDRATGTIGSLLIRPAQAMAVPGKTGKVELPATRS
jgi:hypothetical protein